MRRRKRWKFMIKVKKEGRLLLNLFFPVNIKPPAILSQIHSVLLPIKHSEQFEHHVLPLFVGGRSVSSVVLQLRVGSIQVHGTSGYVFWTSSRLWILLTLLETVPCRTDRSSMTLLGLMMTVSRDSCCSLPPFLAMAMTSYFWLWQ